MEVELKTGKFQPDYAGYAQLRITWGKLSFYVALSTVYSGAATTMLPSEAAFSARVEIRQAHRRANTNCPSD